MALDLLGAREILLFVYQLAKNGPRRIMHYLRVLSTSVPLFLCNPVIQEY